MKSGGASGSGGPKAGDKRKKPSNVPDFLQGCAESTPPSRQHPRGVAFCYDFHNKAKGCKSGACQRAHKCPAFKDNGEICMEDHPIYRHGR